MTLRAVVKRFCDGGYSFWTADLVKKLSLLSVECLCKINENSVKGLVLLVAFFLKLSVLENHVDRAASAAKAAV